jgi:uncharacterized membrane protein YdfJ with MMPL/SSD domain
MCATPPRIARVRERHEHRESLIGAYHLARENLLDDAADDVGSERLKASAAKLDTALGALLDSELADQTDLERLDAFRAELADEASRQVALHVEVDGIGLTGVSTRDGEKSLIPWDQAIAVARRIIELARAHGDLR